MFWYDDELQRLGQIKAHAKESPKMVFYGSSSIRLWSNLYNIYKDFSPINLGFGGSTLAACSWYFDKIFSNIDAKAIVIYAGDNDISDGRHPEEIVLFFMSLLLQIRQKYGGIPVSFISIKPSVTRWNLAGSIHYANLKIKEYIETVENCYYIDIYDAMLNETCAPNTAYFYEDGLHINDAGYKVWETILGFSKNSFPN